MGTPILFAALIGFSWLIISMERKSVLRECESEKTSTLGKLHLLASHKWQPDTAEKKIQQIAQVRRTNGLGNKLVPGISDDDIKRVCRDKACSL
ncbi:hypothetical protein [Vibrio phage vB_pir03]|nr:hypothetical protein [Vibrio phage vB_pir03]